MSTLLSRMIRGSSQSAQDLNERSVPYDKLSQPARSPVAVGTISQGIRGISAPNTNPALTASGTELNKYTMQRTRQERDKVYENYRLDAPSSTSLYSADSSMALDDSIGDISINATPTRYGKTPRSRRSEASSSSIRSDNIDFDPYSPTKPYAATTRPTSTMTARSDAPHRHSRLAPSISASDASSHQSFLPHIYHRSHASESGQLARPKDDAEIDDMFDDVKRNLNLGEPNLTTDQKWNIIQSAQQFKSWTEEKKRDELHKIQHETGQTAPILKESPEWYIKKFLDNTITAKQAEGLLVSLRSKEIKSVRPKYMYAEC